ncbi:MAG: gluconokinase, partial [Flavisolibacter sp.]
GKQLGSSQQFYPTSVPQEGFAEQDPFVVFDAFISVARGMIRELKEIPAVISFSSAMHSLMVTDKSCKPLTQLILWSDSRSASIAEELRCTAQGKKIYEATGTPIHAMSPLCKIMWLQKNRADILNADCMYISMKEFCWFHLFGEFVIDHSLASATGLFDIEKRKWYDESLKIAGINESQLSQPVSTSYINNRINARMAAQFEFSAPVDFCIGASDGCLANLGTYSIQKGIAALSIGTSGAIRICTSRPVRDAAMMNFNYILDEKNYISGGAINNGGNVVQWLLNNFLNQRIDEKNYSDLFEEIGQVSPGADGLIFLPYLQGERAPVWDEKCCGVYFGVRFIHERNHFLRASVEGICFALFQIMNALEEATGPIETLNASGGFVKSPIWLMTLANITGKKIAVLQTDDASAIGAAFMGLKATGLIEDYNALSAEIGMQFLPDKNLAGAFDKNFSVFKKLYPQLKELMHM